MIVSGKQIDLISDEDDAPTAHALGLGGRRLPFGRGEGGVERRLIGKGQHGMAVPARRFRIVIILRHRAMSIGYQPRQHPGGVGMRPTPPGCEPLLRPVLRPARSEEHTSELQSLMRISYAVFCLKKKNN